MLGKMLLVILGPVLAALVIREIIRNAEFRKTTYFRITKNSRGKTFSDKGRRGEYLIWETLKAHEQDGCRFLFNLYLPREQGKTTEIDVLMLAPQGIFVFESKNYSGWIFGSERSKYWTQSLPAGRKSHKERFLNPILQNRLHIRCLKEVLREEIPIRSIIVFSDDCEFKRLSVGMAGSLQVIHRGYLENVISGINWENALTQQDIERLFALLYPYSQVTEMVKRKHVEDIRSDLSAATQHPDPVAEPPESPSAPPTAIAFPEGEKGKEPLPSVPPKKELDLGCAQRSVRTGCPWCDGVLVLRTAKKGPTAGKQFYGCSNYPKCHYTRDIK